MHTLSPCRVCQLQHWLVRAGVCICRIIFLTGLRPRKVAKLILETLHGAAGASWNRLDSENHGPGRTHSTRAAEPDRKSAPKVLQWVYINV